MIFRLLCGLVITLALFSNDVASGESNFAFEEWVEANAALIDSFDNLIELPTGYEVIDGVLFRDKYLYKYPGGKTVSEYIIPDGTVGIDQFAFIYRGFSSPCFHSILIPDSCIDIGFDADWQCKAVTGPLWYLAENYIVTSGNPLFFTDRGVLFSKDGNRLLIYPAARNEMDYRIPDGTEVINAYAFDSSSLQYIVCPDSLISIEEGAFYYSQLLRKISLPENLKYIGFYAFQECGNLKDLIFPSGLRCIDYSAFQACGCLTEITLPDQIIKLGTDAFYGCPADEIVLPASLTDIGSTVFGDDHDIVFKVYPGSYAQQWVEDHELKYIVIKER